MSAIRRIAILFHEKANGPPSSYSVWWLCKEWEAEGIRVELVRGIDRKIGADILFPQIDLSVMPEDYVRYSESFPRVVNRRVRDIRKSTFSTHRVRPGDPWTGRVIVKTDLNYGGYPELQLRKSGPRLYWLLRSRLTRIAGQLADAGGVAFRTASFLDPNRYPIFDSVDDVRPEVFENPALIVERFYQEPSEDGYTLRSYNFLGDRWFTRTRVSPDSIVKGKNSRLVGSPPLPPKLVEMRERLGFDYGKFDFLMHEGEPILLDANTTPTNVRVCDRYDEFVRSTRELAPGIHAFA